GDFVVSDMTPMNCADHTPTSDNIALIGKSGWSKYSFVWQNTFTVSANTNYNFEAWFSAFADMVPSYPTMPFEITVITSSGVLTSSAFNINTSLCNWTKQSLSFNSGSNTSIKIQITPKDVQGGRF